MTHPTRVLLLGATGFIGSYVLRALLAAGCEVLAVRRHHASRTAVPLEAAASGQLRWVELHAQRLLSASDWLPRLQGIDVAINCIGILRQRFAERYEDVHHRMPAALAAACAQTRVRLIHTSALGLHEHAKSRFLSSKLRGEQAIQSLVHEHALDASIVRPSLIDGLGGFGASWLRMLARWPALVVPRGAVGQIAAVQASDLGEAYARLALRPSLSAYRDCGLGGTRLYRYGEYLQMLRGVEVGAKPALHIPLPNWMMRLGAHICDAFRFSPFSYGHWILLQRDNMPVPNRLPEILGRAPAAVTYRRIALKDDFRLS